MKYTKGDPLGPVYAAFKARDEAGVVEAMKEGILIARDCWITRDAKGGVIVQHWHKSGQKFRDALETVLTDAGVNFLRGADFELPDERKKRVDRERKTAKRKAGQANALDVAFAVLNENYEDVAKRRDTVWVDGAAYVKKLPSKKKLLVQFNEKAPDGWREQLMQRLASAQVPVAIGRSFSDSEDGPVELDQSVEDSRWLGRIGRDPHVKCCLACKDLLDQCAVADDDYVEQVRKVVEEHRDRQPEGTPGVPSCQYSGCVLHELNVPRELAMAMVRIGGGDEPWHDIRGVKVSNIALVVSAKDHPEGFDMKKQDAVRRRFKELPDSAGDIYVRLGVKQCSLHVWIDVPFPSRRESAEDAATIEDVLEQHERAKPIMEWCVQKYKELRGLAEMDLQLGE